jgi:tetratricopeptide (TPR) repeat protein
MPHYNLAVILTNEGKTDEANAEYRKAIDLDPKDASPHLKLELLLKKKGKTDDALAERRKAIDLDPRR